MKTTTAKTTKEKFGIHREDIGMALHAALRKACDSTPTSLAWNLISMDNVTKAWDEYLNNVWARIELLDKTPDDFGPLLKISADNLEWGTNARSALKCAFEMFEDDDWSGMAAYLVE